MDSSATQGLRYEDPFLEHRKQQEREHLARTRNSTNPLDSLVSIEINITELCNRQCVFCPRVDPKIYPNQNLHMDMAVIERIAAEISRLDLKCRISFSGFGESLLHKDFTAIIRLLRRRLPEIVLETNTNGDRLTVDRIRELFEAGLTNLYVNLYDGPEQRSYFADLFRDAGIEPARWVLRDHWAGSDEDFGLTLNNRSGTLNVPELGIGPLNQPLPLPCNYPFYKMIVDWNGDVLFCSNDWGREIVVGNVLEQPIDAIWMSETMFAIRRRLAAADRSQSPCSKCNVHGGLHGQSSFERLMDYYRAEGRL